MATDNRGGWDIQNMYHRIHSNQWTKPVDFPNAYVVGGQTDGFINTISNVSKFNKSTSTSSQLPVYLTTISSNGIRNKTSGWFIIGQTTLNTPASIPVNSSIRRLDFSNDSWTTTPATNSRKLYGTAFNLTYGWALGGVTLPGSPALSNAYKLTFSNESWATVGSGMSSNYTSGAFNYTDSYSITDATSSITKYTFSSDSASVVPSKISTARSSTAGSMFSVKGIGYFAGGLVATPAVVSTIDKIRYTGESTSVIPAKLPTAVQRAKGHSDYLGCYIVGGIISTSQSANPLTSVSSVSYVNYSSDSLSRSGTMQYNIGDHVSF